MIVIPTLDEADTILAVLSDLWGPYPILVMDGGSTDGTRDLVERFAASHRDVTLIHNPQRLQAAAVNLGARLASQEGAEVLIRADAHARYPAGWAKRLVHTLDDTGADSVVVPMQAGGQGALSLLQNSWLGTGGAAHRTGPQSGWVTHGHHAAFRLSTFSTTGGYNETFIANEDVEFDARLTAQGGRIWMDASAAITYLPRRSAPAYARQMVRNGVWRARTALLHRRLGWRQVLPVIAILGSIGGAFASVLHPALLILPALYLSLCLALALTVCLRENRQGKALAVCGLGILGHAAFSLGFIAGLATGVLARGTAWKASTA